MFESITLKLPSLTLAGYLAGPADGQPAIALHGWLDNAGSFARLAPQVQGLRVLYLDLAGHGLSGHRPAGADYPLWAFAEDVLRAAALMGWERFTLLGHSLGAIISVQLAAACPAQVERLLLIDGLLPYTEAAAQAPQRLGQALAERLRLEHKRKPVYPLPERAIQARLQGRLAVSLEASATLAERGLMVVPGGVTWRTDPRLMLASPTRLVFDQALAYARAVQCPVLLIVAEQGVLAEYREAIEGLPYSVEVLPGGHHLHLNDAQGAALVATCINRFLGNS